MGGKKNERGNKTQEAQGESTRSSKQTNYPSASEFDSYDGDGENDKHYCQDLSNNSKMPFASVSNIVDVAKALQPQQQHHQIKHKPTANYHSLN